MKIKIKKIPLLKPKIFCNYPKFVNWLQLLFSFSVKQIQLCKTECRTFSRAENVKHFKGKTDGGSAQFNSILNLHENVGHCNVTKSICCLSCLLQLTQTWNESVHLTWTLCWNKQHSRPWQRWSHLRLKNLLHDKHVLLLIHWEGRCGDSSQVDVTYVRLLSKLLCVSVTYHKHCSRTLSVYWKTGLAREAATRKSWMAVFTYETKYM